MTRTQHFPTSPTAKEPAYMAAFGGSPMSTPPSWNDTSADSDDFVVISCWILLGVYGLVTNILIMAGILKSPKFRESTSYWLILSLSLCDMSMILICWAHLVPATVFHETWVPVKSFQNAIGIFIYDSFWYAGVLHLLIMSVNRYVSICQTKFYLTIFSGAKTLLAIGLAYTAGIVTSFPGIFRCCYLVYNYNIYAAHYVPEGTPYAYVDWLVNGVSIAVMIFCYSSIIWKVRKSRLIMERYRRMCRESAKRMGGTLEMPLGRRKSRLSRFVTRTQLPIVSKRELRLFFQFLTVSGVFLLSLATWQWLPRLADTKWIGFVVTSLFFLNNATNPTVYLIFNSALRSELSKIFCPVRTSADDNYHSWAELLQAGTTPFSYIATRQVARMRPTRPAMCGEQDFEEHELSNLPTMQVLLSVSMKASIAPAIFMDEEEEEEDDEEESESKKLPHIEANGDATEATNNVSSEGPSLDYRPSLHCSHLTSTCTRCTSVGLKAIGITVDTVAAAV